MNTLVVGCTVKYDGDLYVVEWMDKDNDNLELWSEKWQIGHSSVSKLEVKVVTFSQWLSNECSLTEEQLRVISLEYGEDAKDYIESKKHEYNVYLRNH